MKFFLRRAWLIREFNLIASTSRFRELQAEQELCDLLDRLGDSFAEVQSTSVSGILICRTHIHPLSIPGMLVGLVKAESWRFRYVLRVLPIERVVPAETNRMRRCARQISERIKPLQTFRITLEKRYSGLNSQDLIRDLASDIDRKVNLSNPDWIILVEVIQKVAGLAAIKPNQIFSSTIEMRKL